MKKQLYLLLVLLMSVASLSAQNHWTVAGSYRDFATVTNGHLNTNVSYPIDVYEFGAFIDGECRGTAVYSGGRLPSIQLFIGGDANLDQGKTITFKVYNSQTDLEFVITPESELTWSSGTIAGSFFQDFIFYLTVPTAIALPANIPTWQALTTTMC